MGWTVSLTEPGVHSELGQVIRHGAHEPVCIRLPHGVEQTVKDHEPDVCWVVFAVDIYIRRWRYALACVRSGGGHG
jgi:hypothetical protein